MKNKANALSVVCAFMRNNSFVSPNMCELGITYPEYLILLVLWETREQTVNIAG
jgi:DNA-binding MarR family transcriptional regulator